MTANALASLGPSTFNRLVGRWSPQVTPMTRRRGPACVPGTPESVPAPLGPISEAAWRRYQDALAARDDLERSWADYCAIRYGK